MVSVAKKEGTSQRAQCGKTVPGAKLQTTHFPTSKPLTLDEQVQRLGGFLSAFPDLQIRVEEVIAEGNLISFRSTLRGMHQGEFLGIAPTGKAVTVNLLDMVRIENGKFVEQWGGPDLYDLIRQLGASVS